MQTELLTQINIASKMLGALLYYSPDDAKVRSILAFFQQADWAKEWQPATGVTANSTSVSHIEQGLQRTEEELVQQYQMLFIGPNTLLAPPWGSVYLDPEAVIFGSSLLTLRQFLRQHQINFIAPSEEPEDHIGLMLMLTAYLAEQQPELLAEYLTEHLLPWSTRYFELLASSDSLFYQGVAQLCQQTLSYWQQQLGLTTNKVRLFF
ncbi:Tat proofreading chaperone DmsD [Lonepinella koalarum]|uniref:Tat proofreading chaperone DmsD n=1 Tax=Lonepinella koalarum TaxID=53417 RepID=UPI003F6DCAB9